MSLTEQQELGLVKLGNRSPRDWVWWSTLKTNTLVPIWCGRPPWREDGTSTVAVYDDEWIDGIGEALAQAWKQDRERDAERLPRYPQRSERDEPSCHRPRERASRMVPVDRMSS